MDLLSTFLLPSTFVELHRLLRLENKKQLIGFRLSLNRFQQFTLIAPSGLEELCSGVVGQGKMKRKKEGEMYIYAQRWFIMGLSLFV